MIGSLRHRVTHKTKTTSDDGVGGQAVTWATGLTYWAEVLPAGSRESVQAGAIVSADTFRVTLRWTDAVAVTDRLVREPEGTTLEIIGLRDPDGRRRWLEIDAAETRA